MKTKFKKLPENKLENLLKNNNFRNNQNYVFWKRLKINSLNYAYTISKKWSIFNKKEIYIKDLNTNKNFNNYLNIWEIWYIIFSNNSIYWKLWINTEWFHFLFSMIIFFWIMYIVLWDILFKELSELIIFMLILVIFIFILWFYKFFYYRIIIKKFIFYKTNIKNDKIIIYKYK